VKQQRRVTSVSLKNLKNKVKVKKQAQVSEFSLVLETTGTALQKNVWDEHEKIMSYVLQ
jgi:hypothetical protein